MTPTAAARTLTLVSFLLLPATSQAQTMFAGYDDFCGVRVIVAPTPQQTVASQDAQGPILLVDPFVLTNLTTSRVFAIAHECAHHKLGHFSVTGAAKQPFNATHQQELDADCFAARNLVANGYGEDLQRATLHYAADGARPQGPFPYGVERANQVATCAGFELALGGANSCAYADDGQCDEPNLCAPGTDTNDCQMMMTGRPPDRPGANSCPYADDGLCDEPYRCARGTDTNDCRITGGRPPRPNGNASPSASVLMPVSATMCVTHAGACAMTGCLSRGAPCMCATPIGPIHGVAQ
jgi:hypothetical protein